MFVQKAYVRGFRNLLQQEVFLQDGLNVIVGRTGQGKSAFLEALAILIFGSSFRTHFLRDCIQFSCESFFVEATVNCSHVKKTVDLGYDGMKRHVRMNGQTVQSTKELLGTILGVSASLSDMELIIGSPLVRRRYLDEQIAEIDPVFVDHLTRASRALQHRNVLLRTGDLSTLDVWNELLAQSASHVIEKRRKTAHELIPHIFSWLEKFAALSHIQKDLDIRFRTQLPEGEERPVEWLQKEMQMRFEKERLYKKTLIGHHRDDLLFLYKGLPLKQALSLGQLRLMVLSIRLAEWSLLKQKAAGETPVFLLDDIDGTLDAHVQKSIFCLLQSLGQVVVTSHSPCPEAASSFTMESGLISQSNTNI